MSLLAERYCVDDVTMISDPVGQCALTTVAEDTVQFVAPINA